MWHMYKVIYCRPTLDLNISPKAIILILNILTSNIRIESEFHHLLHFHRKFGKFSHSYSYPICFDYPQVHHAQRAPTGGRRAGALPGAIGHDRAGVWSSPV